MDVLVRRQSVPVYQSDDGTAGQNSGRAARSGAGGEVKQSLNRLIAMLNDDLAQRDYIAGDTFSIADMALAPLLYPWREVCHDRPDFPHIERWFALIETRPAYRDIVALPVS